MAKNHHNDGFKLNYPVFLSAAIMSLIIGIIMIVAPDIRMLEFIDDTLATSGQI